MQARITAQSGPGEGSCGRMVQGGLLKIGRGSSADYRVKDPAVSRVHCELNEANGKFLLTNLSMNGTWVNGEKITNSCRIQSGDEIIIGNTTLEFVVEEQGVTRETEPMNELVGTELSQYKLERIIAQGQSSVVFLSHHVKTGQKTACKVLRPEVSTDDQELERFVRGMKTMLPVRHPNIVQLYNAGRSGRYCWMAMEYVDGESLDTVIKNIDASGMIDWGIAFGVTSQVAQALNAAYSHRIIHRNITPTNILVRSRDRHVKLADLMLAKSLEGELASRLTQAGIILGEVYFLSPERTLSSADKVDCRSDLYSLGATIYAMLTGQPPFRGDSLSETIGLIRKGELRCMSQFRDDVPASFQQIVLRMLANRPEDRYQKPIELLLDLERTAQEVGGK